MGWWLFASEDLGRMFDCSFPDCVFFFFFSGVSTRTLIPLCRPGSVHIVSLLGNRPFWKFNNPLLQDTVFGNLVKQVILDVKKRFALPVHDRENIRLNVDDHLVLTINGKFFFKCYFEKSKVNIFLTRLVNKSRTVSN